jgi:uncharacterized protein (DUF1499 family)
MRIVSSLLVLFVLASCQEYKVELSKDLNKFQCPQKDNCLSSKDTGESNILYFKMMGEDESQNILNISKLVKKLDAVSIKTIEKNYLHVEKDGVHLEFLANRGDRKIHIRSQASKSSLTGSNNGKKLIEEIRFKFYQNDY